MANWLLKIQLKDLIENYNNGSITVQEFCSDVSSRLKALVLLPRFKKEDYISKEFHDIADEFLFMSDDSEASVKDTDALLDRLYDWGDITLNSSFPQDKLCWIE